MQEVSFRCDMEQALKDKIRALRLNAGLSQRELAEKSCIPLRTYVRIELGEVSPQVEDLDKVLAVVNKKLEIVDKDFVETIFNTPVPCGHKARFSPELAHQIASDNNISKQVLNVWLKAKKIPRKYLKELWIKKR